VPIGVQREDRQADMVVVVDQRLAETRLLGLAHERLLLGPGEDRPGDRVIGQREAGMEPAAAVGGEDVPAGPHSADDALQRVGLLARGEDARDPRVVEPDRHLGERYGSRHPHPYSRVFSGHLVGPARQHGDRRACAVIAGSGV
jgi:hypothetical protein